MHISITEIGISPIYIRQDCLIPPFRLIVETYVLV